MKRLPEIAAAHALIDSWLEGLRQEAVEQGNSSKVDKIDERKKINDQAYFVLGWGQMETAVNGACLKAVKKWSHDSHRNKRRAWSIIEVSRSDKIRLSFEQRAELILDEKDTAAHYKRLMQHYELRNRIAHGAAVADSIDFPAVIAEFNMIQGAFES